MTDTHLHLRRIDKHFGTTRALAEIELEVARGSFVTLLGPSGCGKTTLLRIIAGFESASAGQILLDGRDIAGLTPERRGFGMVFQSLALFPHMSVADNIGYGLKLRRAGRAERRARVEELLALIQLPHIADRPVSALSGGQRQRVAIARALAVQPPLFLLDEPLSALDAKLRDAMQIELRQLQRNFGVTTILVTHDQAEAMMLADALVVMKDGRIRQAGAPTEVYRRPADAFVADFLGAANILPAEAQGGGRMRLLGQEMALPGGLPGAHPRGTRLTVALRAEDITLQPPSAEPRSGSVTGTVRIARHMGAHVEWLIAVGPETLRVQGDKQAPLLPAGAPVGLSFAPEALSVFAA